MYMYTQDTHYSDLYLEDSLVQRLPSFLAATRFAFFGVGAERGGRSAFFCIAVEQPGKPGDEAT